MTIQTSTNNKTHADSFPLKNTTHCHKNEKQHKHGQ